MLHADASAVALAIVEGGFRPHECVLSLEVGWRSVM
jgi:hypothetical protein